MSIQASAIARPDWYQEIADRYAADKSQFLLDFNIRDKVFVADNPPPSPGNLQRVDEYLSGSFQKNFDIVLSYSLTTGIRLIHETTEKPYEVTGRNSGDKPGAAEKKLYEDISRIAIKYPDLMKQLGQADEDTLRHDLDPMRAFMFLDRLLMRQYILPSSESDQEKRPVKIALIVDFLENLAPASQAGHRDQVILAETLSRWANSEVIRRNGHLIVLLAEDINQISPALYAGSAGTVSIRIDRPNPAQRLAFLNWIEGSRPAEQSLGDERARRDLASLTAGFNIADIQDLIAYADLINEGRLDGELIKLRKRDIIRAESRNLLEIIDTEDVGFDHVGGLEHVKEALRDMSTWLRSDDMTRLVPKGLLFVGPPGTGKSLVAQALARESGVNMVKLRDVQSMWVGESERNMSRVLDVARAFAPVIIFVDEIDQAYGQRSSGDSTGVSSRLFGKLLEFMGDNANRGKVLWVAASNRPDFVDAALISRFDRVIPFLLPDRANREEILLQAMPRIVKLEWSEGSDIESWSSEGQDAFDGLLDATEEFSGREIELVVRRGVELAEGSALVPSCILDAVRKFEHSHDRAMYRLQTYLALQVTNFKDYMPDPETLPDIMKGEIVEDGQIDREKLQDEIRGLRRVMA